MKKVKKLAPKIILGSSIAFISPDALLGGVSGYYISKFLSGKHDGHQRIKSIIFNIGDYRLHLHHWLIGFLILIYAFLSASFSLTYFSFSFLSGLIIQDLYLDSNWKKVVIKQKRV